MTAIPTEIPAAEVKAQTTKERSAFGFYVDVLSTVMTVIVVIVAAIAIVLAVATRLSPAGQYGQYRVFGHPVMMVLSGSMSPTIKTGDLIVDNPVSAAQAQHLHVGQIISFRDSPTSRTVLTHRIVKVTTADGAVAYITKGDANNSADASPRPAADVLGTFSYAIPRGGYILNSLHRPLVLGLLLASPILWFIAGPLFQAARKMDEGEAGREPAITAGNEGADTP
jgi:signal peptidase